MSISNVHLTHTQWSLSTFWQAMYLFSARPVQHTMPVEPSTSCARVEVHHLSPLTSSTSASRTIIYCGGHRDYLVHRWSTRRLLVVSDSRFTSTCFGPMFRRRPCVTIAVQVQSATHLCRFITPPSSTCSTVRLRLNASHAAKGHPTYGLMRNVRHQEASAFNGKGHSSCRWILYH